MKRTLANVTLTGLVALTGMAGCGTWKPIEAPGRPSTAEVVIGLAPDQVAVPAPSFSVQQAITGWLPMQGSNHGDPEDPTYRTQHWYRLWATGYVQVWTTLWHLKGRAPVAETQIKMYDRYGRLLYGPVQLPRFNFTVTNQKYMSRTYNIRVSATNVRSIASVTADNTFYYYMGF